MSTGILTEAADIAKDSVVGVNPVPSIVLGISVFAIIFLIGIGIAVISRENVLTYIGVGLLMAILFGAAAGGGLYKIQFYIANPKLAAGLYATDMLLGRR